MTDNPHQHMAKQFVDMWQKQLSDMLVDENFVANMIDMMHQTGGAPHVTPAQPTQPHAANSTVSPDASNAIVGQLERRLASAEGRLAELEREMAGLRRQLAGNPVQQRGNENRDESRRKQGTDKAQHKSA